MAYIKTGNIGTIIKLHKKKDTASRLSSGLVKLDSTGDILEFSGILALKSEDIGRTKIAGTIVHGENKKPVRLTHIKRW